MNLKQCQIIELPKISDPRGNLSYIEGGNHIPFAIQRVYYLYDIPGGEEPAGRHERKFSDHPGGRLYDELRRV